MIKPRNIRRVGRTRCTKNTRRAYGLVVRKPEVEILQVRSMRKWEHSKKVCL